MKLGFCPPLSLASVQEQRLPNAASVDAEDTPPITPTTAQHSKVTAPLAPLARSLARSLSFFSLSLSLSLSLFLSLSLSISTSTFEIQSSYRSSAPIFSSPSAIPIKCTCPRYRKIPRHPLHEVSSRVLLDQSLCHA